MLRSMLLGAAMLLPAPASAQSAGSQPSPIGTATNDHDPTEEDEARAGRTVAAQVNGGVNTPSPAPVAAGDAAASDIVSTHSNATWTGAGGPFEPLPDYPPCTRTRTDSCRQRGGR